MSHFVMFFYFVDVLFLSGVMRAFRSFNEKECLNISWR
jgi:hypothetical protein